MSQAAPTHRLLGLLYLVGGLILADQIADVAATVLLQPGTTGTANWRVAVYGLAASRASILLLADVLLFVAAVGLGHRVVLRVLALLHGVLVLALAGGLLLFGLDVLEVQRLVREDGKSAFIAATGRAVVVSLVGLVLLAWTGVVAWRESRAHSRRGRSDAEFLVTQRHQDPRVGK